MAQDNEEDLKALTHILRYYMFRRTHEDTLFGHPILNMPDIEEQTCEVLLCKAERHLYRELMVRCISELFGEPVHHSNYPTRKLIHPRFG